VIQPRNGPGTAVQQQSGADQGHRARQAQSAGAERPPVAPWTQSYLAVLPLAALPSDGTRTERDVPAPGAEPLPIGVLDNVAEAPTAWAGSPPPFRDANATASPVSPGTPTSAPRQEHGQDQPTSWCVAGAGELAVFHRQLVTKNGDFDVLVSGLGPRPTSPRIRRTTRKTIVEAIQAILADAHSACSEPRSCTCTRHGSPAACADWVRESGAQRQDPLHPHVVPPPFDEVVLVAEALSFPQTRLLRVNLVGSWRKVTPPTLGMPYARRGPRSDEVGRRSAEASCRVACESAMLLSFGPESDARQAADPLSTRSWETTRGWRAAGVQACHLWASYRCSARFPRIVPVFYARTTSGPLSWTTSLPGDPQKRLPADV